MWCSRLLLLAMASVPLLACDRAPTPVRTPTAPPNAALAQNAWFPIQSDYLTCNGDVLYFTGRVHVTSSETYGAAGTYHSRYALHMAGTATGPDGSEYNIASSSLHLMNDPPSAGISVTWTDRVKLTGKGPAENETFIFPFHVTLNASGEVTTLRNECKVACERLTAAAVGGGC